MVGMIMTGIFATKAVNSAGSDGLFYGDAAFFFTQIQALAIVVAFSFTASFLIFKFINYILPLRVSQEDEELGLDASQHNEKYLQGTLLVASNGHMAETEIKIEKGTLA
jgi:Amt family ammonium transporter